MPSYLQSRRSPFERALPLFMFVLVHVGVGWTDEPPRFNRDIRPILADNCLSCHGVDSVARQADLRLDRREGAIESGAIVPGDSEASELIARVLSDDADYMMPPPDSNKKVTDEQRALLTRWIDEGAEYEKHWSLNPAKTPAIPTLGDTPWPVNEIDRFVLARLQGDGLTPAAEADPRTLFRRLSLDTTGLPPEPALVDQFVADYADGGEQALSEWIDRLIDSDAWGEHRARYWLDAARYGDTHGLHFDNYREIWPYRDWVIRSFNDNQPFDQFTLEQLAGDLLENPTIEQRIATGFQRCAITTNEGGTIDDENLAVYASDRVQTFGWVYLGLTTNCCQCHDHKFDPLSMKDYYALSAFFRNTTQPAKDGNVKDGRGPAIRVPSEADRNRWEAIDEEIAAAKAKRDNRRSAVVDPFDRWLDEANPEAIRQMIPIDGRLAHLPIDDGKGNEVASDESTNELEVKATGDLTWVDDGRLGAALQLKRDATLDLGALGDFPKQQTFSHSEWIRTPRPNRSASILARMDEGNKHRGWDLYIAGGRLSVHIIQSWPDNAIKVSTEQSVIKKDTWHHTCVTWDGSGKPEGIKIYVDGTQRATKVDTNTLTTDADVRTTTPLRIGQRSRGAVFAGGSVQDFHLFDRVLSASEVKRLGQSESIASWLEIKADERSDEQRDRLQDFYLHEFDEEFPGLVAEVDRLESERGAIESRSPVTLVQVERMDREATANILMRGEYDNVGDEVVAATPEALHPMAPDAPKNRLGLARWVIDPANPLTARVTVNRFWQEVFGQGIVVTPEDFGVMGALPTHPELLDWLATDFVSSGWDVKRFFKQVFMSATYRQAARVTPEKLAKDRDNSLYSRGPRFRMDAEMVRDYALSVSGLRSPTMYGPGSRPYQPTDIWNVVGLPGGDTRDYKRDNGEGLYRRSIYSFWKRMAPPPSLVTFNAPSREVCTVRRERTNTPLQALVTLNDPQFVEAARVLAENAIKEGAGDDEKTMDLVARRVLCRPMRSTEKEIALRVHADLLQYYADHPQDAEALIGFGESVPTSSLDPIKLAAWAMTCNQIMNLDETLTK